MKILDRKLIETYPDRCYDVYLEKIEYEESEPPIEFKGAFSTIDGSYIGEAEFAEKLWEKHKVKAQSYDYSVCKVACIGYSESEEKWYGWSHRAMFGFGVGSSCKKGDLAFIPSNREEYLESLKEWYSDEMYDNLSIEVTDEAVTVTYEIKTYNVDDKSIKASPNVAQCPLDIPYGRGEWTAETLEDAKEMAIAYAKAVA